MALQQPASPTRWTPSLPTSFASFLNPFAARDDSSSLPLDSPAALNSPAPDAPGFSVTQYARRAFVPASLFKAPPTPATPHSPNGSAMFAEPDVRSRSNSDSDSRDDQTRRVKKTTRAKTCYSVCHAPPTSAARHKLHRRPRALLQLHMLSANARPQPAYEVIPSANFSVRLTRTMARLFQARHALCPNDLVVLRAENYSTDEAEDEQQERDVLGLICFGRRDDEKLAGGKARIYLTSGREWEAYPKANGAYEFFAPDDHGLGLTVRWVPKRLKDGSKAQSADGARKFNFSTVSPNTRRHPVIASLSKTGLDINDTYRMPSAAAATPLSSPRKGAFLADAMDAEDADNPIECVTDERLREIITTTAIWVTFKEGWSPSIKLEERDRDRDTIKSCASPSSTPPGSPGIFPLDKRGSIKSISSSIMRRTSLLGKPQRASAIFAPDEADAGSASTSPVRSASIGHGGRTRADSTSTVLVHQAASNRRKSTVARQAAAQRSSGMVGRDLAHDIFAHGEHQQSSPYERDDSHASHAHSTPQRRPSTLRNPSTLSGLGRTPSLPPNHHPTRDLAEPPHDRHRSASFQKEIQVSDDEGLDETSDDDDHDDTGFADHPPATNSQSTSLNLPHQNQHSDTAPAPQPATSTPTDPADRGRSPLAAHKLLPDPPHHKRHSLSSIRFRSLRSKPSDDAVAVAPADDSTPATLRKGASSSPRASWRSLLRGGGKREKGAAM